MKTDNPPRKVVWLPKLEIGDYQYFNVGLSVLIRDIRNQRTYPVPPHVVQEVIEKYTPLNRIRGLIEHCINTALIPHPYEELV